MKYLLCLRFAIIYIIVMILVCSGLLYCESEKFEKLTIEDGLSQSTVFAAIQDSKGFLWFGTEDGLNRYDGYSFKDFKNNPDDLSTLSNNRIRSLLEDREGNLWVGTQGGGLNRLDREKGSFVRYKRSQCDSPDIKPDIIWSIYEDHSGNIWVGTDKGLAQILQEEERLILFGENSKEFKEINNCRILSICEDRLGNLWIATLGDGLVRIVNGRLITYKNNPVNSSSLIDDKVRVVYEDSKGVLWIGTDKGLEQFDYDKNRFVHFDVANKHSSLKQIRVLSIYEDRSGILWIGTFRNGLYRLINNDLNIFKHKPGNPGSLSSNYIQSIYEDASGVLWVGSDCGLNKLDKKKEQFGCYIFDTENKNRLSNGNVWAFHKDESDLLFIGTEGGCELLDRKRQKSEKFTIKCFASNLNTTKIVAMCMDNEGELWIGTESDGLYRLNLFRSTCKLYKQDTLSEKSISSDRIRTIYQDRSPGNLWVGTKDGLNLFKRKEDVFIRFKTIPDDSHSLSDNYVEVIYQDRAGNLWIGTKRGLNLFHQRQDSFEHWKSEPGNINSLLNDHITALWEDQNGSMWIGTLGGGINRLDRRTRDIIHYLEKDGLPNNVVYSILGDNDGFLWLSTNKGISKFDPQKKTFRNYDARDGLQSNEFNAGAYFKSTDGELFFGGINGFNAFYPEQIKDNPHIPPIVITDFQILNEPVPIGKNSPLKKTISEVKELVLSYKHYVFSFDFAALDFSSPGKNKYAFKMEGFDNDWIHRDAAKRFATYTNLDPGEYTFRVIGSNNDGVWNKDGTSIKITIVPPFWKTTWFIVLMAVAFAVLSYLIINFVKTYIMVLGFWKRENYIGKFKLLDKIGAGGMGTIFTAQDTTQKSETVAIKVLRDELFAHRDYRKRFIQEAAIIDQLDHPNVVKVIERGQYKQKLFIVMELLKGKTLAKKIEDEKRIDLKEVFDIMIQILDALVKIHGKGIVHRDLKPENVMLIERKGNCNFVKLLDFGLAKTQFQTRITQTGAVLGTINYMSPEQVSVGDYSSSSDVYAVGAMFYESVTGLRPFCGETVTDIMKKIMNDTPTQPVALRHDIPDDINALIMEMLEKDIEKRPNVDEVLIKLKEFRSGDLLGKLDTDQTELFSDS